MAGGLCALEYLLGYCYHNHVRVCQKTHLAPLQVLGYGPVGCWLSSVDTHIMCIVYSPIYNQFYILVKH